jgi:hypothetical protein
VQAASRVVAFAALLALLAPSAPFGAVHTWIQSSRRRAARTNLDDNPEIAVASSEPPRSSAHELPSLEPCLAADADRLAPPAEVALEPDVRCPTPPARFDRARPPARAPPRLG